MRIIDGDIDRYTACVEHYGDRIRRCVPLQEPRYCALRDSAQTVLDALIAHRDVIDRELPASLELPDT